MDTKELAELMKSRRSIRSWLDKPVSEDALLRAIELATWAPNGGNQQNWMFYVVLDRGVIQAIADAVQGAGTVDHTPVYPREVVRRALELAATALVVAAAIPLTVAMTLAFCQLLGIDLQQVSIAAMIIPGVQKPHCSPWLSWKACCIG